MTSIFSNDATRILNKELRSKIRDILLSDKATYLKTDEITYLIVKELKK